MFDLFSSALVWFVMFISLYVTVFWIFVIREKRSEINYVPVFGKTPMISVIVPAYNEENIIDKTIESLLNADYPKEKLEIIIVDDGSTDMTKKVVEKYVSKNVKLISQKNSGKGAALNNGIKHAKGELVACMDADSVIPGDTIKKLIGYFDEDNVAAAVAAIKPIDAKKFIEKLQEVEYIISNLVRKLLGFLEAIYVTPGAFALYRKDVLEKVGYFAENHLTEDLEIAYKFQMYGYKIRNTMDAVAYTDFPKTVKSLVRQRVRWYRGMLQTTMVYRKMFANKKYGYFGTFQLPLIIIFPIISIFVLGMLTFSLYEMAYNAFNYITTVGFVLPVIKSFSIIDFILSMDVRFWLPTFITVFIMAAMIYYAYKYGNEKVKSWFVVVIFFLIFYTIINIIWVLSIAKEFLRSERTW